MPMSHLQFPDNLFQLDPDEQPMYGELPALKAAVEYCKSLMTPDEWKERRTAIAKRFYESLTGEREDPDEEGKYFDEKDLFGWYLFLGESFSDHPWNYEVFFGSRVVPIFASIGRALDHLKTIEGFHDRALQLISQGKSQPNGILFEMLVAAAYAVEGAKVVLRRETPGGPKSHDLDVELGGKHWAVECKRMEVGEYVEAERKRMHELWKAPSRLLMEQRCNSILDVNFKVELSDVPDTYLLEKAKRLDRRHVTFHMWSDRTAWGSIAALDIRPIQGELSAGHLLHPSPRFTEALTGAYYRTDNRLMGLLLKCASNPHFVEELDLAVVLQWSSLSEDAVEKKARDILKRLSEATAQLPTDRPGIAHIGFEALGADPIEARRFQKITQTMRKFDRGASDLKFIYCHYFAPDTTPDHVWVMDETVQQFGISVSPDDMPLYPGKLLLSDDTGRAGVHWE